MFSIVSLFILIQIIFNFSYHVYSIVLTNGQRYSALAIRDQPILIEYNFHELNGRNLSKSLIIYTLTLNLRSNTNNEVKSEMSRILPLQIYTINAWTSITEQLPFYFKSTRMHVFSEKSFTICPFNNHQQNVAKKSITNSIFELSKTTIMTYSPIPINFTFTAKIQSESETWITKGKKYFFRIPPQTPKILRFRFEDDVSIVRLVLTSDDDKCMIIGAEHTSCPTSTTSESKIESGSLTQRMQNKGVLLLEKSNFRDGELFIVLETQPSNESCLDNRKYNAFDPWQVNEKYIFEFYTLNNLDLIAKNVTINLFPITEVSLFWDWVFVLLFSVLIPSVLTVIILGCFYTIRKFARATTSQAGQEQNSMKVVLLPLIVQSSWYFIGVFQLLVLSRAYIHRLGDSHLCFVDYDCAKPYVLFNIHLLSFNNIFSNFPYIMLGFSYIFLVYIRKKYLKRNQNTFLFVSLGVAMIMQGSLSAMYHICPSNENFQFDITYMYTLCLLHIVIVLYCNTPNTSQNNNDDSTNGNPQRSFLSSEHLIQTIFFLNMILCWIVMLSANLKSCLYLILYYSIIFITQIIAFVSIVKVIKNNKSTLLVFKIIDSILCYFIITLINVFNLIKLIWLITTFETCYKFVTDFNEEIYWGIASTTLAAHNAIISYIADYFSSNFGTNQEIKFLCKNVNCEQLAYNSIGFANKVCFFLGIFLFLFSYISLAEYFLLALIINLLVLQSYFLFIKYKSTNNNSHKDKAFVLEGIYFKILLLLALVFAALAVVFYKFTSYKTNKSSVESLASNKGCFPNWGIYDAHDWWHIFSAIVLYFLNLAMLFHNEDRMKTDSQVALLNNGDVESNGSGKPNKNDQPTSSKPESSKENKLSLPETEDASEKKTK